MKNTNHNLSLQNLNVSLIIPVLNEENSIKRLAKSIELQTRLPNEILFVDGGSTDKTIRLIEELALQNKIYKLIKAERATPGRGRNIGAANAQFEWLAFTDAGIRLEPNWLEGLVKVAHEDEAIDVVYGNYEPEENSFFEKCAALAYVSAKTYKNGEQWRGASIASVLMRCAVWQKVGGFPDLRAAEDLIFMENVEKQNFKIAHAPRAVVWWKLRPDLGSTFQKFVLYSKHNVWAGRERFWHYGVLRQYLIVLPFVALGLVHSFWWFVAPVLWIGARTMKSIWTKRENRGLVWALNLWQFFYVMLIILIIDAATFIGWAQALLTSPPLSTNTSATSKAS